MKIFKMIRGFLLKDDSFFHSDEQPEVNLGNDYPNKTGHNLTRVQFCKTYLIVYYLRNQTIYKN